MLNRRRHLHAVDGEWPGMLRRVLPVWLLIAGSLLCQAEASAQGSAGSAGKLEPRFLVDIPTAGMIGKGTFAFDLDFYQEGGILLGFTAGVFDRFSVGISYGGSHLLGGETPVMNKAPGFALKIRVLEESIYVPAFVLGFDSQGQDGYIDSLGRYAVKSPGLYAVVSKNYSFLGYLSVHGGVNYSFEHSDGNTNVNTFVGLEKTLGPIISVVAEYNLAANDAGREAVGQGKGYLNAALKCSLGGGFTLGVNFKDLAQNKEHVNLANRTVTIEYVHSF